MISWGKQRADVVLSGAYDAYIAARADGIKALGKPVFLRWFWEMDFSDNLAYSQSPAAYGAAWRHIHAIFSARGATNVAWVWCPNASSFKTGSAQRYYPGDDVVDWICADGYNFYPDSSYREFEPIFAGFYAWASQRPKPLMIAEYGDQSAGPVSGRPGSTPPTPHWCRSSPASWPSSTSTRTASTTGPSTTSPTPWRPSAGWPSIRTSTRRRSTPADDARSESVLSPDGSGYRRIQTAPASADKGGVKPFHRLRTRRPARRRSTGYVVAVLGIALVAASVVWSRTPESEPNYLRAAMAGGDYLVAQMHDDGSFVYQYDPISRKKSASYNMLRHAGTTYSLIELYEATRDAKYLAAAESGLDYLKRQIIDCPTVLTAACVIENDEIKLGGNALALLALSKYMTVTGSATNWRSHNVLRRSSSRSSLPPANSPSIRWTRSDVDDFESGYYPGEAIYALSQLHQLDHNQGWIDAAHEGARWLITVRDAGVAIEDLDHDHWLLYGLREVYSNKPDSLYVEHAKKIVQSIAAVQHRGKTKKQSDWNGGFRNPPGRRQPRRGARASAPHMRSFDAPTMLPMPRSLETP